MMIKMYDFEKSKLNTKETVLVKEGNDINEKYEN